MAQGKANPGYLKRAGFRIIDNGDGSKRLQQSSEKSALGRYKFDFPNDFAVYLHDTPAQSGFRSSTGWPAMAASAWKSLPTSLH